MLLHHRTGITWGCCTRRKATIMDVRYFAACRQRAAYIGGKAPITTSRQPSFTKVKLEPIAEIYVTPSVVEVFVTGKKHLQCQIITSFAVGLWQARGSEVEIFRPLFSIAPKL